MSTFDADVCVVGAGFAGLAAGRHLMRAGRSVAVLEARDRVGGRVHSKRTPDGLRLDVGGTWVGPGQDRILPLLKEYGFAIDSLTRRFGPKASKPLHVLQQDWAAEPWSQGGMIAMFRPGVLTTYGPALRQPVGRIHWASTETAIKHQGLIDGAIGSGERAAGEVMAGE